MIAPLTRSTSTPIIATESHAYRKELTIHNFSKPSKLETLNRTFLRRDALQQSSGKLDISETTEWNSFKKQQRTFVLIFLLRPLPPIFFLCKHESQKVFFGEWAWHEGAIKMLVVLKRKALFWKGGGLHLFSRCGIKIFFIRKKKVGWMFKWWNSFYFSSFSRLFLSERNNMELLCASFIKNFNITEI